jgi:hypothetical protein
MLAYALRLPHYGLTGGMEKADTSLVTQGWVDDKLCRVTVDSGAYAMVARLHITAGWPDRQPNPGFMLQTARQQLGNQVSCIIFWVTNMFTWQRVRNRLLPRK